MPEAENKTMRRLILVFVVLGVLAGVAVAHYFYTLRNKTKPALTSTSPSRQEQINFSQKGTLVRNSPGMKPNTWYLVYGANGAAAEKVEMEFTVSSQCSIGELNTICTPADLVLGAIVEITGYRTDSQVRVHTLKQLDLEDKG